MKHSVIFLMKQIWLTMICEQCSSGYMKCKWLMWLTNYHRSMWRECVWQKIHIRSIFSITNPWDIFSLHYSLCIHCLCSKHTKHQGHTSPPFFCTGNLWVMDVGWSLFSDSDRVLSPWTGKMLVELITFKEMVWFKPQKASNQTKGICYRHRHSLYRKLCSNPRADI